MSVRPDRDEDQSFGRVLVGDLQQTRLGHDYARELRQLYYFYLDDERRADLAKMGRVRRAFSLIGWLLWSMYVKLSPPRRLMVGLASLITIAGPTTFRTVSVDFRPAGFVLLFVVLMLELKDKLLAKDEIAIAREVQLALMPSRHPQIPGWEVWSYSRPANDVGGDLVDYVEIDAFRHGILLGDVSGKGLGAALLSAKLQATIRAVLPDVASLDDLGRRVNKIFANEALDNRFATLFYAQLEHDSAQLRYLNAGHNPAFLITREGAHRLAASSYPLGMLGSAEYEEGVIEMRPGDVLLCYSDGLTEATNEQGEEFGMARLEALIPQLRGLSSSDVGIRLLHEADAFLGEARAADDLSLAVIVKR
jgi:sigma-B regulation protein RsbU (phosphoserine phosphatase)